MLLHLIKKEFVVIQKQTLWMIGLVILIPLFILWRLPQYANYLGFVFSVIYGTFIMLSYICLAEYQCEKASAYLCTTPYPRKYLVLSKYFFCLIVYLFCALMFRLETLFLPQLGGLSLPLAGGAFLLIALLCGIYLPICYYFGYDKTKFVYVIIVLGLSYLLPSMMKFNITNSISRLFMDTSPNLAGAGIFLAGILIFALSALVSVRIYDRKDLV